MTIFTLDNLCWLKLPLTRVGSMYGGNINGWICNLNKASPKMNI